MLFTLQLLLLLLLLFLLQLLLLFLMLQQLLLVLLLLPLLLLALFYPPSLSWRNFCDDDDDDDDCDGDRGDASRRADVSALSPTWTPPVCCSRPPARTCLTTLIVGTLCVFSLPPPPFRCRFDCFAAFCFSAGKRLCSAWRDDDDACFQLKWNKIQFICILFCCWQFRDVSSDSDSDCDCDRKDFTCLARLVSGCSFGRIRLISARAAPALALLLNTFYPLCSAPCPKHLPFPLCLSLSIPTPAPVRRDLSAHSLNCVASLMKLSKIRINPFALNH